MYTRNQGSVRPTPTMRSTVPLSSDRMRGADADNSAGMPILIPQDYRGEFLRGHRTPPSDMTDQTDRMKPPDTAGEDLMQTAEAISTEPAALQVSDTELIPTVSEPIPDCEENGGQTTGHGTSLIGGLYDLLLGENSSEEETLLLLGIGLLLLWGHLDRGGLFDRSTWDSDDLALLLIGYLLLS